MFNNLRGKIFNEVRERVSKYLLGNIGDVVDLGDELVCYFDKKKCDIWGYDYHINCVGIDKDNCSLADKYKLNKPVCYVIRNINFGKGQVTIYGDNCKIFIDSCKFNDGFFIRQNGRCEIRNSFIKCSDILSIKASSLKLENTNISNNFSFFNNDKTDLSLKTNRDIEFVNSKLLKNGRNIDVFISTGSLVLNKSSISVDKLKCNCSKMIGDDSSRLEACSKIDINNKDISKSLALKSPIIIYNGREVTINNDKTILREEMIPIRFKRLELISVLTDIRDKCKKINEQEVMKYSKELEKNSLKLILKK